METWSKNKCYTQKCFGSYTFCNCFLDKKMKVQMFTIVILHPE
uniref:Uncharacterized protein n=1 Tax=Arundo donax TaxID=35708 RepID=A0A0A9H1B4_ARUDO